MNKKSLTFRMADIFYLFLAIMPIAVGILLKVLFTPASEGIEVTGALIYFTVPLPLGGLPITESQINSWLVIISILGVCLFLTHGITRDGTSKRQILAEWLVEKSNGLVLENMGEFFLGFSPFIGAVLSLSAFSSLLTLFGLYPPTSDLNVVAGWAVLVFVLITFYKGKAGLGTYLKSFAEPVAFLFPINVISEVATPVSMAFRHYGNVLSGSAISIMIGAALQGLSGLVLGWLPGFLGEVPFLQIGIPAVFSVYFDVFSGLLQAFIFAMLTMLYVAGGFPAEKYFEKKAKKQKALSGS